MFYNPVYSQHNEKVIDKNPIYFFEGTGYSESGTKKRIAFSKLNVDGDNKNEVSLNNNEFTVKKDGIYRINLSSEINKIANKEKQVNYLINLNAKAPFQSEPGTLSLEGVYSFQIQLKEGDQLSFDIQNDKITDTLWKNNVSIRFTDPKLITFFDDHQ